MPAQPQWLLRLPEIIDEISALDTPIVDRSVIERAFGLRRRRAIHLLGWFGGYQVGRAFVVERETLLRRLRGIAAGERFGYEKRRRERLAERLERLRKDRRAAGVVIPVAAPAVPEALQLPSGVFFQHGRLVVEFRDVPDLLGKLYGVAQTAAGDFAAFEAAATTKTPQPA
jgi:hypothetical protein